MKYILAQEDIHLHCNNFLSPPALTLLNLLVVCHSVASKKKEERLKH